MTSDSVHVIRLIKRCKINWQVKSTQLVLNSYFYFPCKLTSATMIANVLRLEKTNCSMHNNMKIVCTGSLFLCISFPYHCLSNFVVDKEERVAFAKEKITIRVVNLL